MTEQGFGSNVYNWELDSGSPRGSSSVLGGLSKPFHL
jgi:hypothetical protein